MSEIISINQIMLKLKDEETDNPAELSKYLILLTANMWKYGQDTIEKEVLYAEKWQKIRAGTETDGQANIRVKSAPEYYDWKMAQVMEKNLLEMIRSIKKRLSSLTDELRSY